MKISVLTPTIRPQYLELTQKTLEAQTFQDFEWLVEVALHSPQFTLPRDMNKMLSRATGDIIVSLQDCIEIPTDALEIIAALDHTKTAYTYPVGKKHVVFNDQINYDWRYHLADGKELTPERWELDLGSASRDFFYNIGGYDEEYCNGWSFDNVDVGLRGAAAGYEFRLAHDPIGIAVDHDALIKHPHRQTLPMNSMLAQNTRLRAEAGDFKLNYLL